MLVNQYLSVRKDAAMFFILFLSFSIKAIVCTKHLIRDQGSNLGVLILNSLPGGVKQWFSIRILVSKNKRHKRGPQAGLKRKTPLDGKCW